MTPRTYPTTPEDMLDMLERKINAILDILRDRGVVSDAEIQQWEDQWEAEHGGAERAFERDASPSHAAIV